jgi:hypothetical protein
MEYGIPSTLLNNLPDDIELLYHFTSKEIALEKILSSGELKFSILGNTNDPRETKHWLFNLEYTWPEANSNYVKQMDLINNILKNNVNLLCFTIDNSKLEIDHNLRNGYMHSRSWSQYASNHTGICLLFEKSKLTSKVQLEYQKSYKVWHGKVEYINRTIKNPPKCLTISGEVINKDLSIEHIEKYYSELFFEKRNDWEDENEYRIIIFTSDKSISDLKIDISDCIVGLIVGVDFNKVYEPCVFEACNKYNIEADRIQWSEGLPVLQCPIFSKGRHKKNNSAQHE